MIILSEEEIHFLNWIGAVKPNFLPPLDSMVEKRAEEVRSGYESETWHKEIDKPLKNRFGLNKTIAIDAWSLYQLAEEDVLDSLEELDCVCSWRNGSGNSCIYPKTNQASRASKARSEVFNFFDYDGCFDKMCDKKYGSDTVNKYSSGLRGGIVLLYCLFDFTWWTGEASYQKSVGFVPFADQKRIDFSQILNFEAEESLGLGSISS